MEEIEEILQQELGLDLTEGPGPGDRAGQWTSVASHFGSQGYIRILVRQHEGLYAWLELASPRFDRDLVARLEARLAEATPVSFKFEQHADAWHASAILPTESAELVLLFAQVLKLADLMSRLETGEDARAILADLYAGDGKEAVVVSKDTTREAPSEFESIGGTDSGFEPIGEATGPKPPEFGVAKDNGTLTVEFGIDEVLDDDEVLGLFAALRRNLRAKFDTTVERSKQAPKLAHRTVVVMVLTPDDSLGTAPSLDALKDQVSAYFKEFVDLGAEIKMSPLVYLGIRDSAKHPEQAKSEISEPPSQLSVEEDDGDKEVVFSVMPASDDSLVPGNFVDDRLNISDATDALVDIVLRHPGYSDRRVGQVLSILLSIEYHEALLLMNSAPCIIATAVAQARARTMKRVVERAGGKLLLTEPGRFSPI